MVKADRVSRRRMLALLILVSLFAVVLPVAGAVWAVHRQPSDWGWGAWVSQLTQILTGIIFFTLAWYIGRASERRSEAVANAELITSMGALSTSSARSYAGHDAQALKIAADARAALQHYGLADDSEQHKLTERVTDAYSDLIFGTFSRANGLPRSMWRGLQEGADELAQDAHTLAANLGRWRSRQCAELEAMARHIEFAVAIGKETRDEGDGKTHNGKLEKGNHWVLDIWPNPGSADPTKARLAQLELLYRHELTVIHSWRLLQDHAGSLDCEIALHNVGDTGNWLSPWYAADDRGGGGLVEVNVQGLKRDRDVDRDGRLIGPPGMDLYPRPMIHSRLPDTLRRPTIDQHLQILDDAPVATICVLTYELQCDDRNQRRRIVLDGNHRLAAATRLAHRGQGLEPRDIRVLEFRIQERSKVTELVTVQRKPSPWTFHGFTPDVARVRSAWAPVSSSTPPTATSP